MHRRHLMGEIKQVLLSTDGSVHSDGAEREALFISSSCGVDVIVLQVLEMNPSAGADMQAIIREMEREPRARFEELREKCTGLNIECLSVLRHSSNPHEAIIEEARKRNVDLIVMGRRDRSGMHKVMMGNVTERVIAHAPCKVLVVPQDAEIIGEQILLATDGSSYAREAEKEAISMALRCDKVRHLIAVCVAPDAGQRAWAVDNVERVRKLGEQKGVKVVPMALVGRPYHEIVEIARREDVDFIVIGRIGKTGAHGTFMGNVSEKVVALAPCAVLIVR